MSQKSPAKAQIELIGEDGKKSVLAPDRVLFESRATAALSLPLTDLKKKLQELRSQISATAQAIDLRELWELVREETDADFSWEELAGYGLRWRAPNAHLLFTTPTLLVRMARNTGLGAAHLLKVLRSRKALSNVY